MQFAIISTKQKPSISIHFGNTLASQLHKKQKNAILSGLKLALIDCESKGIQLDDDYLLLGVETLPDEQYNLLCVDSKSKRLTPSLLNTKNITITPFEIKDEWFFSDNLSTLPRTSLIQTMIMDFETHAKPLEPLLIEPQEDAYHPHLLKHEFPQFEEKLQLIKATLELYKKSKKKLNSNKNIMASELKEVKADDQYPLLEIDFNIISEKITTLTTNMRANEIRYSDYQQDICKAWLLYQALNNKRDHIKKHLAWQIICGIKEYFDEVLTEIANLNEEKQKIKIESFNKHFDGYMQIKNGQNTLSVYEVYTQFCQLSFDDIATKIVKLLNECNTTFFFTSSKLTNLSKGLQSEHYKIDYIRNFIAKNTYQFTWNGVKELEESILDAKDQLAFAIDSDNLLILRTITKLDFALLDTAIKTLRQAITEAKERLREKAKIRDKKPERQPLTQELISPIAPTIKTPLLSTPHPNRPSFFKSLFCCFGGSSEPHREKMPIKNRH